eukprot:TRINITY_DN3418_c0_g1_i1.p1 TRINITY_DN3418_c0_g1~~TRINITY_DN3418_c0_g1_i1.p1  ORF type:complete len:189 (+),score=26.10 TRINITY_DN3418_c0_g1_i1:49-615(+)
MAKQGYERHPAFDCVERVLYDEATINKRVEELADQISADYAGKEIVLIGILKGASMFMTDLAKRLTIDARLDFMSVSSYGNDSKSSGAVKILLDVRQPIKNRHCIIVEDIVDTGLTLKFLQNHIRIMKPASLTCCVLLNKPDKSQVENVKYVGFDVKDEFFIGYGLDYAERFRTLPYIGILKESVYKK